MAEHLAFNYMLKSILIQDDRKEPEGRGFKSHWAHFNYMKSKMPKSEAEWKTCLSPEEYHIMREKGTEAAFTGKYYKNKKKGMYICAGCGAELFSSDTKYDSGTGWPSFREPSKKENVETKPDSSLFMQRTEVLCKKCGGHLGHVFDDGPQPTGKRFCINSASLHFKEKK